jgi:DNA-binding LytR/AlgR family response regulator
MNCIAIDDEPLALELIEFYCSQVEGINLVKSFSRTSDASKYLRGFPVDLIFLDIQMPDISGIDFYKQLDNPPMVIFTTAHSQFAIDGFNLSAVDFLLKPFELSRFEQAVDKAKAFHEFSQQTDSQEAQCLFVRSDYKLIKIQFHEILYMETLDDYLKIHILGKKPILTLMSMKSMVEKLPDQHFIRIHRSYVIPFARIESVRGKSVDMGITELPISKSYEAAFFKAYVRHEF